DDCAFTNATLDRFFDRLPGLLVDDAEHFCQGPTDRLFLPASQGLSNRVHQGDKALGVSDDHGIPDAGQSGVKPILILVERLFFSVALPNVPCVLLPTDNLTVSSL